MAGELQELTPESTRPTKRLGVLTSDFARQEVKELGENIRRMREKYVLNPLMDQARNAQL